jgi:hypothetical protein
VAGDKTKASQLIMKRGIMLVSSFYICWSVMIYNGFSTAVGTQVCTASAAVPATGRHSLFVKGEAHVTRNPPVQVHPGADVMAAWMAKMMPLVDSTMLLQVRWEEVLWLVVRARSPSRVRCGDPPLAGLGLGIDWCELMSICLTKRPFLVMQMLDRILGKDKGKGRAQSSHASE